MNTRSPKTRTRPRGYLMLEVLISGACISASMLFSLELIGYARQLSIRAARDITANQLAEQGVEIARALALAPGATKFASLPVGTSALPPSSVLSGYTRTLEVTDPTPSDDALECRSIVVTVSYSFLGKNRVSKTSTQICA